MNPSGMFTVILFIFSVHFSTGFQGHPKSVSRNTPYVYSYLGLPQGHFKQSSHHQKNSNIEKTSSFGTPLAFPQTLNYENQNPNFINSENYEKPEVLDSPLNSSSSMTSPSTSLLEKLLAYPVTYINWLLPPTVKKLMVFIVKAIFDLVVALLNIPPGVTYLVYKNLTKSVKEPATNNEHTQPTLPPLSNDIANGDGNFPKYMSPDQTNPKKINEAISDDIKNKDQAIYDYNSAWTPFLTNSLTDPSFSDKENVNKNWNPITYPEQSSFTNNEKPFRSRQYFPNAASQFSPDANKLFTEYSIYSKPLPSYYKNDNRAIDSTFINDKPYFSGSVMPYTIGPKGYSVNTENRVDGIGLLSSFHKRPSQYLLRKFE